MTGAAKTYSRRYRRQADKRIAEVREAHRDALAALLDALCQQRATIDRLTEERDAALIARAALQSERARLDRLVYHLATRRASCTARSS